MESVSKSANTKRPKLRLVLTGFGKFNGVENNPTTHLTSDLRSSLGQSPIEGVSLHSATVLTVAALDALRFVSATLADLQPEQDEQVLVLHLGVAASRKEIHLERCAYNEANFLSPDERGWAPLSQPIFSRDGPCSVVLRSPLNLDRIAHTVEEKVRVPLRVSDDPGRFLCNYIYYCSAREVRNKDMDQRSRYHALFVHVPMFEAIPRENQLQALLALIEALRQELCSV